MNPAPSGTPFADDDAGDYEDYEGDEGELGYNPPPHDSQHGSDWHNPNLGGYYQPPQFYPLPDPEIQSVFDQ